MKTNSKFVFTINYYLAKYIEGRKLFATVKK